MSFTFYVRVKNRVRRPASRVNTPGRKSKLQYWKWLFFTFPPQPHGRHNRRQVVFYYYYVRVQVSSRLLCKRCSAVIHSPRSRARIYVREREKK